MSEPTPKPRRVLRDPIVRERTGLSRTQRWRCIRSGTFPAAVQLGPNSIGWYEDEIEAWLAERPRVSYAPSPTATPPRRRGQSREGGT